MTNPRLQAVALACERDWRLLFENLDLQLSAGTMLQVSGPNGGSINAADVLAGLTVQVA